jgi:hypothetical protein
MRAAVAFTSYEGTRSQLRGQIDSSLRGLTGSLLTQAGVAPNGAHRGPARGHPGSGFGGFSTPPTGQGLGFRGGLDADDRDPRHDLDEGLGLDDRNGPAFGGAPGTLTLVRRDGTTYQPRGQREGLPVDARAKALARRGYGQFFADLTVRGTPLRVLGTGLGWRGALLVALPLSDIKHTLRSQLLLLALIAAAGVLLAGLLGVLVARTALAPIVRFTRQTEQIAANPERLDEQRLVVEGDDELARLGQSFNRTLDALEQSVQAQRNLVADASHELRTPIATIRANLQLMRDEELLSPQDREALRADVIDELDELTALVGDVVELARGTKPGAEAGDVRLDQVVSAAHPAPSARADGGLEPRALDRSGRG